MNHLVTSRDAGRRGNVLGFLLLVIALIVEGYDLQAANFAAPDLVASFGVTRGDLGPLLSASLLGLLIGSVFLAPMGDRMGRKRVIICACLSYGFCSLAASLSPSLSWLMVWRLLIGVGLGAVLPNALALAGELAPSRLQSSATGLVGVGITLGGVAAGVAAAQLVPEYGWRSLFALGGVLPVFIAALLFWKLPESPVRRDKHAEKPQTVWAIIQPPMLLMSLGIWVIFALVLMNIYLLSGWIPLLMADAGFSPSNSAWLATAYHFGGVGGGVVASLLLTKRGWGAVAILSFMAAITLSLLTLNVGGSVVLGILIVSAGFFVTGTQNAVNGATGGTYPAEIRAAGLGWGLGFGRLGSVAGPMLGSLAVVLGMEQPHQFFALPVAPLLLSAVIAILLHRSAARRQRGA